MKNPPQKLVYPITPTPSAKNIAGTPRVTNHDRREARGGGGVGASGGGGGGGGGDRKGGCLVVFDDRLRR